MPQFHRYLIQSLEAERDQYLKDFGSNRFSFVREIAERIVEQNNQLIQKLESLISERVSFYAFLSNVSDLFEIPCTQTPKL
jgi:hypothetical protein